MAPAVLLPGMSISLNPEATARMLNHAKSIKFAVESARPNLQSCCCLASEANSSVHGSKVDNASMREYCQRSNSSFAIQRRALLAVAVTTLVGTPSALAEGEEYNADESAQTLSSLQSDDKSTDTATNQDPDSGSAELASADSAAGGGEADAVADEQATTKEFQTAIGPEITKQVYFDISVDGETVGRIVIGLYGKDVPTAAARFAELAMGKQGVGYRRKDFYRITSTYFLNSGVRTFSVGASPPKITGGFFGDEVESEWAGLEREKGGRLPHVEGAVSLVVRDPTRPPPEQKLIARNGRLMMAEEDARPAPNGTEFAILTGPAPELDTTNLVIGRVIDGMDVARLIGALPAVKDNSESGYFRVAKAIGDKRATVAERGFNRPYAKILIADSGVLD